MSFRFLTAGESHGKGLVGILEGIPSGLSIDSEYIQTQMRRRKLGFGRGARQKMEDDRVEILSGVRHGKTLGSPISLLIWNQDWQNWSEIMQPEPCSGEIKKQVEVPRPGHADRVGGIKYAHTDMRNVLERASARETAMRVALGSFGRKLLEELGVEIASRVVQLGKVEDSTAAEGDLKSVNEKADSSVTRCLGADAEKQMIERIERAKTEGDTLGGVFEVLVSGLPVGLGSYVQWDRRIEGNLAQSLMSLNAIKGVEIGMGFAGASLPGSQAHDEFFHAPGSAASVNYRTNRSGGIEGGMTSGQNLVIRAAMKPLATLMNPLHSVRLATGEAASAHVERSDVTAVPSAAVIGESLVALVLCEAILEKFGGDSLEELKPRVDAWKTRTI